MSKTNLKALLKTRIYRNLFFSIILFAATFSCGYKADPKIPYRAIPQRIINAEIKSIGNSIFLKFIIPQSNERGDMIFDIRNLKIYRKIDSHDPSEMPPPATGPAEDRETTDTERFRQREAGPMSSSGTSTQDAFGFRRDTIHPESDISQLRVSRDFKPQDFHNYILISNIDISGKEGSEFLFEDSPENGSAHNIQKVEYVIVTYDQKGNRSNFSNIFRTYTAKTASIPENIHCSLTSDGIKLEWAPSHIKNDDYTIKYNIYLTDNVDLLNDPFLRPVNKIPVTGTDFTDMTKRHSSFYYLFIRSVTEINGLLFESENSKHCTVFLPDSDEIPPVDGVLHFVDHKGIVLLWRPSVNKNLIGYNIYRKYKGDTDYILLNDSPVVAHRFHDTDIAGGKVLYYITAVTSLEPLIESKPSEIIMVIIDL